MQKMASEYEKEEDGNGLVPGIKLKACFSALGS